eukprot:3942811-Pyramimonas_sp.AAC.1
MRSFHGVVVPTLFYGCEAWIITLELENRVRRTQRRTLIIIIQTPRRKEVRQGEGLESEDMATAATTSNVDADSDGGKHEQVP